MKRLIALAVVLAASLTASAPQEVQAANTNANCWYEVQVEYWFFDTDYSYWRTTFSTTNAEDAQLMYDLLLIAKQNHQLNAVVPNEYWRYIAVDVRLVKKRRIYQFNDYGIKPIGPIRSDLKLMQ